MTAQIEWAGLTLLDPWFLLLLPVVALLLLWRQRTRRAALPTASVALFAVAPSTLRLRLRWLPLWLQCAACVALTVALARPVEREVVPLRQLGVDIVLVLDLSSSMNMQDMRPDEPVRRIDAARQRAEQFAAAREVDRVGLVVFGRYAELRCPPTLDERALAAFLRVCDTYPENSEFDATAIGTGLAKAVQVLRKSEAKSKVVVLLSDGENNVREILPEEAAKLAVDAGVRVHTIGLGSGQPGLFRMEPLEFDTLKAIARTTGGEFFAARDDRALEYVYARIDELEKSELDDPRYRTVDRFELPLGVGLLLLALSLLADVLWLRTVP